ncbi:MAG: TlpA disulfide reductase family protein [Polyangiaceae bacterium]
MSESRTRCPIHGLVYDPSVEAGCVVCRRGARERRRAVPWILLGVGVLLLFGASLVFVVLRGTWRAVSDVRARRQGTGVITQIEASEIPARTEEAKGKVRVVHLWATWCPTCRGELPEIDAALSKYSSDDVEMMMLAMDDSPGAVERFVAANPMTFTPVQVKPYKPGELGQAVRQLGGKFRDAIPYTLVLSPSGAIVAEWTGGVTREDYQRAISEALEKG